MHILLKDLLLESVGEILSYASKYKKITNGMSDGRLVRQYVPNMSSIGASLNDYEILDGIYDIPISEFKLSGKHYSVYGTNRINDLANEIKSSNEINPLIVVLDDKGPYVLEGSHRVEALYKLGAKSFPSKLVLDKDLFKENIGGDGGEYDGDKYFSSEAWNIARGSESGKSRHKIVHISPDEFMTVAEHMPTSAMKDYFSRSGEIGQLINDKVKLSSIPILYFAHDGKGNAKVVSHDGRHRALALSKLGIKYMPVLLTSRPTREGMGIRWSEQSDPNSFDYYKGVWPKVLKGETSGQIKFPIPDLRK